MQETGTVGTSVLVQRVQDKSKLRARVASNGFAPYWNMRFPGGSRQESTLYVVGRASPGPGNTCIASGDGRRFAQVA